MLKTLQWLLAGMLLLPMLAIVLTASVNTGALFMHLVSTRLADYFINTLMLMVGVGALSLVFGVGTAWITSRYEFAFRKQIEWMLVLPLAVPSYIVAYAYTDFLEYSGPLQTLLRDWFGWRTADDYYFPDIRSMGGAMVVMASVLYPYIYITVRTVFQITSTRLFEAAILAGHIRLKLVALPLARSGIIAGLALVLMEVVSDFGTVEYFALDTLTLGIFNVWLGMGNINLAAQLALAAVGLIVLLLWLEKKSQAGRRIENTSRVAVGVPIKKLRKGRNVILPLICLVPIFLGFIMPVAILLDFVFSGLSVGFTEKMQSALYNTLSVALSAAAIIMAVAVFMAIMATYRSARAGQLITTLAAMGYAFPGTILAIGVLAASGYGDGVLRSLVRPDFIITGSLAMMIAGYVIRYQAIGYGTVQSGLKKLPTDLLGASEAMGHGFIKSVVRIILPLLRAPLLAGFLIAFVDIMKELPMSLLLRPFNFDTLATITYEYAKEELLEEAALPALIIVLAGLIPMIIINRSLTRVSRQGY